MVTRNASARWEGNLKKGTGQMSVESGLFQDAAFSFHTRFEDGTGTNPDELIGAALAGCFSMALSNVLDQAGHTPESVETTARVFLATAADEESGITKIELTTEADVPGIDEETFQEHAQAAKEGCPVGKALSATTITLNATLTSQTSA